MNQISLVEALGLRNDVPDFRQGDTLSVQVRVVEGEKERLQQFKGVVISRQGAGISATMTLRKISHGIGVERIFPVHAPIISTIEVVKRGSVRRAKLYYLRKRTGKAATKVKDAVLKEAV